MTNASVGFSQLQFFSSLGFMGVFFAIELGLAWVLVFFKLAGHWTHNPAWTAAYRLWVRVFALASIFALAASMPVLIQFGSLWPLLSTKIGDVSGPLIAATILTAFVFKSCFLGVMLFGQRKVSQRVHTWVVVMVALGATASAFWAMVLQSWMQTPSGTELLNGQYMVTDWPSLILNPSSGWLMALLGSVAALTTAFLLVGTSVRQSFRHPSSEAERAALKTGVVIAMITSLLFSVAIAGYGLTVAKYQPAKAAATAAYWQTGTQPDLVLFAWPQSGAMHNRGALLWHHAGGKWLGQDENGEYLGLDRLSGMHPPVLLTFWSFRLMAGLGLIMALASWITFFWLRRKQGDVTLLPPLWRRLLSGMTYSGWLLALASLAHVWLGHAPYAVGNTTTLAEIAGTQGSAILSLGIVASVVLYGFLAFGFTQLLRYFALYGVVPVARRRRRA